ncbi:MAG TPA: hypothetical protein PLC42_05855 [Parachlamydiaceae bacterium]|nr:hypothetical protein [Parachlamydiaceae bacterium]
MKINEKVLSIPPYLSTTWQYVASIKMKGALLSVTLIDGDSINIPNLSEENTQLIFKMHATHIEAASMQELSLKKNSETEKKQLSILSNALLESQNPFSLKFGFEAFDGMNAIAEHNPLEMDAPDLPAPLLDNLSQVAKIITKEDAAFFPEDVANCNCFHCQITRTINQNLKKKIAEELKMIEEDEIVLDKELEFNQWNVIAEGKEFFTVINKLDDQEQYKVFLGSPVGCNCGKDHCEHIIAALRT